VIFWQSRASSFAPSSEIWFNLESVKLDRFLVKTLRDMSVENGQRCEMTEINKLVKERWNESKENYDMKCMRYLMTLGTKKEFVELLINPYSLFDRLQVIQIYCFLTSCPC
jgi:hypothetical protein